MRSMQTAKPRQAEGILLSNQALGEHKLHQHNLRERWKEMCEADRREHVSEPLHLYAFLSGFVPRGVTESRIAQFARCVDHIGSFTDHRAQKYSLPPALCADVVPLVDALVRGQSNEGTLRTVMRVQDCVERDLRAQGWTYDASQNFVYRTPLAAREGTATP